MVTGVVVMRVVSVSEIVVLSHAALQAVFRSVCVCVCVFVALYLLAVRVSWDYFEF